MTELLIQRLNYAAVYLFFMGNGEHFFALKDTMCTEQLQLKTQHNDDMAAKAGPANLNIIIDVCYARLNPTGAVDKIWPYIT